MYIRYNLDKLVLLKKVSMDMRWVILMFIFNMFFDLNLSLSYYNSTTIVTNFKGSLWEVVQLKKHHAE